MIFWNILSNFLSFPIARKMNEVREEKDECDIIKRQLNKRTKNKNKK